MEKWLDGYGVFSGGWWAKGLRADAEDEVSRVGDAVGMPAW